MEIEAEKHVKEKHFSTNCCSVQRQNPSESDRPEMGTPNQRALNENIKRLSKSSWIIT
jgi:hypothetical protein